MVAANDSLVKKALTAAVDGGVKGAAVGGLKGALTGAGIGAVAEGAKGLASAALDLISTPDDRLRAALAAEQGGAVAAVRPELEQKIEQLIEMGTDQAAMMSNMVAIFTGWEHAWRRCTDAKKRRLLMAALLNSFDQETYEDGLTASLFSMLAELDYGDLWTLKAIQTSAGLDRRVPEFGPGSGKVGSLGRWHLERLRTHGLVYWSPGAEREESARNDSVGNTVRRSVLGERLLEFVAGGFAEDDPPEA